MKVATVSLLAIVALCLPAVAFAQPNDGAYCQALVAKYQAYLNQPQNRGQEPQNVAAKAGVAKCEAGDPSGIPTIEGALRDADIALPARQAAPQGVQASQQRCGTEEWSTADMKYVGVPCH